MMQDEFYRRMEMIRGYIEERRLTLPNGNRQVNDTLFENYLELIKESAKLSSHPIGRLRLIRRLQLDKKIRYYQEMLDALAESPRKVAGGYEHEI